ncbi:hypothetical protein [Acinetobacter sp. neg1]|uniref:hypothetical protein n=1 Tax=Acinetobacter sp. neg1 TaxID=1561068 RepID=UPI0006484BE7|nr:hypothetical protein [Acinetobacter sp. neg1]
MSKGYEFELSDGTILQVVPNDGVSECSVSFGDTKIDIITDKFSFKTVSPNNQAFGSALAVVRFEQKELTVEECSDSLTSNEKDQPHIMRTCSDCNGRYCCATNGCINCGCGWVCDR